MLKILIVDDEMLERKAVAKIITSSLTGVEVVGEAPNGRKAIELAELHEPDLIFMDIKMPGIDGIGAVKAIKAKGLAAKFIMVSAFDTFEYAKEVMQQGVKEYILKPSSKQDILAAVERVSAEIAAEQRQKREEQSLRENLNRAVSIARKEWVASLLLNQVQDISFDEWSQLLGKEITSGYMLLFALQPQEGTALSAADKQRWYEWLKQALPTVVDGSEMVGPLSDMQVPVLLLSEQLADRAQFRAQAQGIVERVLALFGQEAFPAALRIGIGSPYQAAQKLHQSYHEAVLALQQLAAAPKRSYLFSSKQEAGEVQAPSQLMEVEKKLLDAVRQGDLQQVLVLLDGWKAGHDAEEMKQFFEELFVLISRMLQELGIQAGRVPKLGIEPDVLEQCKAHLVAVTRHVQAWRNNHAKGMLHKAKEYIEEHYADSLTLEGVAEYVELSPYYFSKLFKDRFGMTFIDYVTEVRIQRAKTEIGDAGKSLKEICYAVGYKDPNYFSRVFKKHTGLSPSQFRRAVLGEAGA